MLKKDFVWFVLMYKSWISSLLNLLILSLVLINGLQALYVNLCCVKCISGMNLFISSRIYLLFPSFIIPLKGNFSIGAFFMLIMQSPVFTYASTNFVKSQDFLWPQITQWKIKESLPSLVFIHIPGNQSISFAAYSICFHL